MSFSVRDVSALAVWGTPIPQRERLIPEARSIPSQRGADDDNDNAQSRLHASVVGIVPRGGVSPSPLLLTPAGGEQLLLQQLQCTA